jgi:hypothetical protein
MSRKPGETIRKLLDLEINIDDRVLVVGYRKAMCPVSGQEGLSSVVNGRNDHQVQHGGTHGDDRMSAFML